MSLTSSLSVLGTEVPMSKRPEMAEGFFWEDDAGQRQPVLCHCGKRAVVRHEDSFFCPRCWEFLPGRYDDDDDNG